MAEAIGEGRDASARRSAVASIAVFAALLALAFAAYWPALAGGMLWDDDQFLTKPSLRSWNGLARIWTELGATPQYYPVTYSAFWIQERLWGGNLVAHHVLNVVLQAINAFLVWRILQKLGVRGALFAAALFAVHPVQVETVAWITELKNTLSGALYLTALRLYLQFDPLVDASANGAMRSEKRRFTLYAFSLIAFTAAVLAKSVTASLPAVVLLLAWWRIGSISWRRHVLPLAPFFAIAIGLGALTVWMETHVVGAKGEDYALTAGARFALAGRVVCFYLAKLLWPVDLTFIYPRWEIDAGDARQWLYSAFVAALFVLAWSARKRIGRAPFTALAFFVGTLFPVLGFVNVYPFRYSYVADHFQYLACLGPITLFAASAHGAWSARRAASALRVAGCAALVLVLCAASRRQSLPYRDVATLWNTTIERNPACWMAHGNLGAWKGDRGDWNGALESFGRALELAPDLADAHYNHGNALDRLGRTDEALAAYEATLTIAPDAYKARGNRGRILMSRGRIDESIADFERALAIEPGFMEAHHNLGLALAYRGSLALAIEHFRRAVEIEPRFAQAHSDLAQALARSGDIDGAIAHLERALSIQPNLPNAAANLERLRASRPRGP